MKAEIYYSDGTKYSGPILNAPHKKNKNKVIHNLLGPAIKWDFGKEEWWISGKKIPDPIEEEYTFEDLKEIENKIKENSKIQERFKYNGPAKLWVQIDSSAESLNSSSLKNEVCVSSFNSMNFFKGGGSFGYIWYGKPSYHFPGNVSSGNSLDVGEKRSLPLDFEIEKTPWDEAWLTPKDSKLVGLIYSSKENNKEDFLEKDIEGLNFLRKNIKYGLRGFVRLNSGKNVEIFPNDLLEKSEKEDIELEEKFDKVSNNILKAKFLIKIALNIVGE